jgi:hypothetical protein
MSVIAPDVKEPELGQQSPKRCWICGEPADSGEHKTKRSDLKAVFGKPTQSQPLFYHDNTRKNRRVKSLDAKLLKSPDRICQRCNNTRTQPHDLAWQRLSEFLAQHSEVQCGGFLRCDRVFPDFARQHMREVHLYFAKLFGCLILEGDLRIDLAPFAKAILEGRCHPNLYLKFGRPSDDPRISVGRSDVWAWPTQGPIAFATWFYSLPHVWVNVMFAVPGQRRDGLVGAWHPSHGTKRLLIADFDFEADLEHQAGARDGT